MRPALVMGSSDFHILLQNNLVYLKPKITHIVCRCKQNNFIAITFDDNNYETNSRGYFGVEFVFAFEVAFELGNSDDGSVITFC